MHFPIIVFEALDVKPEDYKSVVWSEDDTNLQLWVSHIGGKYNEEDRKLIINSDWLKEAFKDFATIDKQNETINFLFNDAILKEAFEDLQMQLAYDLVKKFKNKELSTGELRFPTRIIRNCHAMFYIASPKYGYTMTLYDLLAKSPYLPWRIFRIGNIIDAY